MLRVVAGSGFWVFFLDVVAGSGCREWLFGVVALVWLL